MCDILYLVQLHQMLIYLCLTLFVPATFVG
uniref:Uncharacterized protein n=1 Tax=Anguilla anguilla TaxID=7936 RepID=A0A0E9VI94_ANGAN